ncbi:MAG: hypothetical protein LBB43_01860 [Spirochaetaceae bacterium]|jgi:hypothetical protein|nr:hypothetical protein [Spirochaetaceae bacterium]
MVDKALINGLNFHARELAGRWKDKIRNSPQLKHYNSLDDIQLTEIDTTFYPLLARTLDRGLDRSLVGSFFVNMGKDRMRRDFPISEVIYAINLAERTVIEYVMTNFVYDNPVKMYSAIGFINNISEFFILGCFYLTKGFLEETYTHLNKENILSEELLKQYFKDDFFFKKN